MDKDLAGKIEKYLSLVNQNQYKVSSAYLFGSYAKNTSHPESDIDIALVIENLSDIDKFDIQVELMMLALKIDSRIEPHPISTADFFSDNPFAHEIKKTGIKINIDNLSNIAVSN
jgi:uncharacterized protein